MKSENVTSAKEDPKKIQLNKQNDTKQQIAAFTMQQILGFHQPNKNE